LTTLTEDILRECPKVLLHDHLDGGLRPSTVIELAEQCGYNELPTKHADELGEWFFRGANKGSLPEYLEGFKHTCAVMQTPAALERVAYEMMEDMHRDGVVYVETRFAPIFHTDKGLHWDEAVKAVLAGLERGKKAFDLPYGLIICAMRHVQLSLEMAELAVDFRDRGVVGLDLAGEEGGYPPKKHIEAFHYSQRHNFNITIHAGEAFGAESIWQAIQWCGAHRIGHATRLVDDMKIKDGKAVNLGYLAQYILDHRVPLELCLSSNVHTGACPDIHSHPFAVYFHHKFRVTLNTDNRLMSNTNMTKEFKLAHDVFGLGLNDFEKLSINSMKSAFIPYRERIDVIYEVIKPGFYRVRQKYDL
jgi:adenosine deaminase